MKTLTQRLDEYLALRRSMGFDLSFDERVLRKFTRFGDENGFQCISTPLFLDWKANYGSADNNTWSHRLGMVRRFASWQSSARIPKSAGSTGAVMRQLPRALPIGTSTAGNALRVAVEKKTSRRERWASLLGSSTTTAVCDRRRA